MTTLILAVALSATASSGSEAANGSADRPDAVCEREMIAAAEETGVPLGVLYAVGLTESGRKSSLQSLALNVEGTSVFPADRASALRRVRDELRRGRKLIDIGCMQINHHYHREEFASLEAMFEPRENVRYAARFLKTLRRSQGSWTLAVARYHAGPNNDPAQKRYVCTVIRNMVASGFGNWTPAAAAFCR